MFFLLCLPLSEPLWANIFMRRMIYTVGLVFFFSLAAYAQTDSTIAGFQQRLDHLVNTNNACIRLGKAVAQRFVDFAKTGGTNGPMSLAWTKMQFDGLAEVAQVLDETERLAQRNAPVLDWTPPKLGMVKLKNGTIYNRGRPYYFYGYGHFGSVIEDLPNFPTLGASLIQDGRAGPSSMNADGTLGEGALAVLHGLDRAAQFGMRDDFLLSPHYYPAWAWTPDLPSGGIGFNFNILHPKARAVIGQWTAVMLPDRLHQQDRHGFHRVGRDESVVPHDQLDSARRCHGTPARPVPIHRPAGDELPAALLSGALTMMLLAPFCGVCVAGSTASVAPLPYGHGAAAQLRGNPGPSVASVMPSISSIAFASARCSAFRTLGGSNPTKRP